MPKLLLLFLVLIAAPLYGPCSKKRPAPIPAPTPRPVPTVEPSPIATPTPSPSPIATVEPSPSPSPVETPRIKPTPFPTPEINLAPYLHEQGGKVVDVTVQEGEDVGLVVNRADASIEGPGKIVLRGGGSIKTQIVTSHDVDVFGEYQCDTETAFEGCWLVKDGSKIEGKGATIYGPTFFHGRPAITVFQTYASAKNNYASTKSVTIKGFRIVGRQTKTDGGVYQIISFGNCIGCAAIENVLEWSPSIAIQCGGGAAQGNHAENCLVYRNKLTNFAAAAIALVNVKGAIVAENDMRDPGRAQNEPGGISGVDIESNNVDDCVKDIKIFNNYIGYGKSAIFSAGNGILGQNVFDTPCSGGLLIANNVIDGWEGNSGTEASFKWGLSGGLYFVGRWQGGLAVNNIITRALQPAISLRGVRGLTVRDAWLISSGGGGAGSIYLEGSSDNVFEKIKVFDNPEIFPGSTGGWMTCDQNSKNNVFREIESRWPEVCK